MTLKRLTLPALDLQDTSIVDKIYSQILQNRDETGIDVMVFPIVNSSVIVNYFTPISNAPFFMKDILENKVDESFIKNSINCAAISLKNIEQFAKNENN